MSNVFNCARAVDCAVTSCMERTPDTGCPVLLRNCSPMAVLSEYGSTGADNPGDRQKAKVEGVDAVGQLSSRNINLGSGCSIESDCSNVANDAYDLRIGWLLYSGRMPLPRSRRSLSGSLLGHSLRAIVSLMMATPGAAASSRGVNTRPRNTGIRKASKYSGDTKVQPETP